MNLPRCLPLSTKTYPPFGCLASKHCMEHIHDNIKYTYPVLKHNHQHFNPLSCKTSTHAMIESGFKSSQGQCRRHFSRPIWHLSLKLWPYHRNQHQDFCYKDDPFSNACQKRLGFAKLQSAFCRWRGTPLGHGIKTSCLWWLHWQLW